MQTIRKDGMILVPVDNDNEQKHRFLHSSLYKTIAGRTDYFYVAPPAAICDVSHRIGVTC
jgi:hypothetical protein